MRSATLALRFRSSCCGCYKNAKSGGLVILAIVRLMCVSLPRPIGTCTSWLPNGKIREDFFYRIHVFEIEMPPLRERKEDIPLLVEQFVRELGERSRSPIDGVAKDTMDILIDYHWPGNVRQLRNAIERASVAAVGDKITFLDLPPDIRDPKGRKTPAARQLNDEESAERTRIIEPLRQTGGNRTKAAELLGTSRVTLWKKIGRYEIQVD